MPQINPVEEVLPGPSHGDRQDSPARQKQDMADHVILDAEHFKANVAAPKHNDFEPPNFVNNVQAHPNQLAYFGQISQLPPEIELLRRNDNDDDFFHITCHIDPTLKAKIERGEYVELERLLSRDSATKFLT